MTIPTRYNTIETIPAEPVETSFIACNFFSFLPFVINPSAKSPRPSVWCIPVIRDRAPTTNRATIRGSSKKNDKPNPNEPISNPIPIPTIGKMYMYFATVSISEFFAGRIVKKENTELISLSMNPPSQIR